MKARSIVGAIVVSLCLMPCALCLLPFLSGCSATGMIPGTGGKNSAQVIEKTSHSPTPDGVQCFVCHKSDIPGNAYHERFGRDCSQCHVKTTWMASKYPHEKWFLDKNHSTRCTFCHTNLSAFDFSYQCWGCHHKEDETRKSHAARNINDITNCVACHKSTEKKE